MSSSFLVMVFLWAPCCHGGCSYPSNLLGDWYSTSFGTLTFTNSSFSGFTSAISAIPLTFSCEFSSGTQYVSKSSIQLFAGVNIDVYLCMNLQQLSSIKYYFTLDSNRDNVTGTRFFTSSAASVSLADVCSITDTRYDGEYELLILKSSIMDSFVTCPGDLLSLFDVTMTTQSITNCNGTSLDGRSSTSTSLTFNYSSCATGRFNAGGYLTCLYAKDSGYVYVNTYNDDASVDGSSTYMFTCFVISKDGSTLWATESPGSCEFGQTSTSVDSPGIQYFMKDLLYMYEPDDYTVLIAVLSSVVFVIIVNALIIVFSKLCRKKQEVPPKVRTRKRKLSVTDYSSGMSRSKSVENDLQVKKKTAGEILTGTLTDKRDAVIDGGGYEPPRKQVWQKKWETEKRPPTPTRKSRMASADTMSGLRKDSNTTSLPENLDKRTIIQKGLSKDSMKSTTVSLVDMRYSERTHASTKIPESTGKFGSSPRPRLLDSFVSGLESTLDPIKENPLSRESTATNLNLSREHTRRTAELANSSARADTRSLLSTAPTTSTLSARDVHLNSCSNLSSRLSASNASIFDDPTWLNENTKKMDNFFDVLKNLIPGLPHKQAKDQKWFIKSRTKPEKVREDIAPLKSRNIRSVGISSLSGKTQSRSSLEIIENEKKNSEKKPPVTKPKLVRPTSPHFEV